MTASRAPGPWTAELDGLVTAGDGAIVAFTSAEYGKDWEANQQAIATLPDLVEALESAAITICRWVCIHRGKSINHGSECRKARAAIAKVRGSL